MQAVKLNINKLQWTCLGNDLRWCAEHAPVECWEVESCLLAELYQSRISFFTFFREGTAGKATLTIRASDAYAINTFLGHFSKSYNTAVRALVEPKLPPPRS